MNRLLIFAFAVTAFASLIGTPHLLASVERQSAFGLQLGPISTCTYWGIQGRRLVVPHWEPDQPQNCPQIEWLPLVSDPEKPVRTGMEQNPALALPPPGEPRVIRETTPRAAPPAMAARQTPDTASDAARPAPAGRFILACLKDIPPATRFNLTADDLRRFNEYQAAMPGVAAAMASQPHHSLIQPLLDGEPIVLDGLAWDRSIAKANPGSFDVHTLPKGSPQVCRAGFIELGKFAVR